MPACRAKAPGVCPSIPVVKSAISCILDSVVGKIGIGAAVGALLVSSPKVGLFLVSIAAVDGIKVLFYAFL